MECLNDFTRITVGDATVFHGSNLDVLPFLAENSVDSIITDPPYELGFMGKKWDSSGIAYSVELWVECLRVLKPGGHLLAFGGSRTWHRLAVAIEDAGFEVRDSIAWLYGSGFPKSHNISIAIDKQAGLMGHRGQRFENSGLRRQGQDVPNPKGIEEHKPISDAAAKWDGWGTALKPAFEPVVVARKPLIGTVAENVLAWGVGGLNIDASRIGTEQVTINTFDNGAKPFGDAVGEPFTSRQSTGRWPANIVLDEYTAELLDEQSGDVKGKVGVKHLSSFTFTAGGESKNNEFASQKGLGDSVGASRFFYVSKANKRDRNEGVKTQNTHPTVKPTDLMRYLIKLVTPTGGTVLDPFTGSGSTGKAALLDGYKFVGIELTKDYLPIIEGRLEWANQQAKINAEKESEKLF